MSGSQVGGLAILAVGIVMTIVCVAMPTWSKNDPTDTTRDSVQSIEGLWIRCTTYSTGNWDCDDFDRLFLGLPVRLQAGRMLGIGSILAGVVAFLLLTFGLDCMPIGGSGSQKKTFRLIAGSCAVFSAAFLLVATSWYANDIRLNHNLATAQRLNNAASNVRRQIFGEALFIGWAGSLLSLVGGLMALCSGCGTSDGDDFDQPRGYVYHPPPAKAPNVNVQEYV